MPPTTVDKETAADDRQEVDPANSCLPKRRLGDDAIGDDNAKQKEVSIEEQPLLLPSELSPKLRAACHPGLDGIKRKMCDAQCRVALDHIWTHLFMKSALTTFKQQHTRGQKDNTHSRKVISDNDYKIKLFRDKFNMAQKALIALGANPDEMEWKEIREEDLRCLEDEEMTEKKDAQQKRLAKKFLGKGKTNAENRALGEGCRVLSWIWIGAGTNPDSSTELHEGTYPFFHAH